MLPSSAVSYDAVPLGADNTKAKLMQAFIVGNQTSGTEISRYDVSGGDKRYSPFTLTLNPEFLSNSYALCDTVGGEKAHDKFSLEYGVSATGNDSTFVTVEYVNQETNAVINTTTTLLSGAQTDATFTPKRYDDYELVGVQINGVNKTNYDATNYTAVVVQDVHGKTDPANKLQKGDLPL